jgi:phosphatidylglycerophosphatase A
LGEIYRKESRRKKLHGANPAAVWLATFGGIGFIPVASGTFGSLGAVALAYPLVLAGLPAWGLLFVGLLLFWPATLASGIVERRLEKDDPGEVVVDEVVGQLFTLAAIDSSRWEHWVAAFVLFRVLDVIKPYPIRRLERFPNGYGVVADDAAAGLCGMIILAGFRWFWQG